MGRMIVAVVFAVLGMSGATLASSLPLGGVTPEQVVAVLKAKQLPAELGKDKVGDPKIATKVDDVEYYIYFYDCKAGRCEAIQLVAGFDLERGLTFEQANKWNAGYRFGRMYLDEEKDPYLNMDINLAKGGSTELIDDNLDMWVAVLAAFGGFLDEVAKEVTASAK